jgi:hypothetical protein
MKKAIIFVIFVANFIILMSETAVATPSIVNVPVRISHGEIIEVYGSGFGVKPRASPLLWDDCTASRPLNGVYDGYLPTNAQQGAYYNISYRAAPFRGVYPPNNRVSYIIGGAHAISDLSNTYDGGGNVALGKNLRSHSYFISYFYRIDPAFDEENHPNYSDNMKELVLTNTEGSFYPEGWGAFGYASWNDASDVNFKGPLILNRIPINPVNQENPYASSGRNIVYHNNPINSWIKMQWEGVYNYQFDSPQIFLTTYPDGKRTYQSHYGDGLTVLEYSRGPWFGYPKHNDLRFIGVGGFGRVPRKNNGRNSFRYFASVYIDDTHARVMLGDNIDYNACTKMEPQIPISWREDRISIKVNLGNLPNEGTAYLFIFDQTNNRNATGYAMTIGDQAGSPLAPKNLKIVE